ncbi:MAG: PIN domain-containing protein [Lamprobacter sp.]|uniref:type II toxin-antitoxin system VapC family toxin n=1 Tax=Lamprobacter sp. TaxID=3100796 RepID=UPI002B257CE2|nr:PIN domain-containing protein [Lamprobacter sp.]MEA3642687.1 PIN domain-containing protein [Lamprobacter sp.]
MKIDYVADTMAIVLRLENRKLPARVKTIFNDVESGNQRLAIPAMALAELGYLAEKKRIETSLSALDDYISRYPLIVIEPMTANIIHQTFLISNISELHDRIIAATAVCLDAVLVTNDPIISASGCVRVVW